MMIATTSGKLSLLGKMVTNTQQTLAELSEQQPIMLVFLRHFGCTFCREALSDLSRDRENIEASGTTLVFVHMTDYETAERYFQRFNLPGVLHISDPECRYYAAFGLVKGNFNQLFGLQTWIRGFSAGMVAGHGIGGQVGDGFQMPGVFIIQESEIKYSFIHKLASERPDYLDMLNCCSIQTD
ncbi:MAG TPA: peroxiredoxin-like family protein [Saprospiraceae bacterium]|nr:peroxiredoxin-like family protein [Saprospiraceae bacterium]HMQ85504.1 peroxiredoxin-like family protein [Saprospiraceae bacterium]